ncbi:MAG: hypothetical protein QF757_00915 [Candidatus Marinimicrobia bacterium]|jgi:hypothetical protein|nr:hypothetical protein [Candidatus Neomarinimicrobiota bacterium]
MTTEKQIEANRKNALKGGVKTQEGKDIVKYNAEKHQILRETLFDDEQPVFDQLAQRYYDECKPETQIEETLIQRIVFNTIQLHRCSMAQSRSLISLEDRYNASNTPEFYWHWNNGGVGGGGYSLILRYETNLENRIYKALNQLDKLQRRKRGEVIPSFEVNLKD